MPRRPNPDRIRKLEQQAAKIDRELRRAKAVEKKQERDLDARRCIIAGRLALKHFEKNAGTDWGKLYFRLLDEYVEPRDRFLFEFLPVRDPPAVQDNKAPAPDKQTDDTGAAKPDQIEAAE